MIRSLNRRLFNSYEASRNVLVSYLNCTLLIQALKYSSLSTKASSCSMNVHEDKTARESHSNFSGLPFQCVCVYSWVTEISWDTGLCFPLCSLYCLVFQLCMPLTDIILDVIIIFLQGCQLNATMENLSVEGPHKGNKINFSLYFTHKELEIARASVSQQLLTPCGVGCVISVFFAIPIVSLSLSRSGIYVSTCRLNVYILYGRTSL